MRVNPEEFVAKFDGKGGPFEDLMNDLVRAVGRTCGVGSSSIHWDYRTDVGDGGRDIIVDVGAPGEPTGFIPTTPSVWSLKSGAEGVSPASLRKEVLPQQEKDHPKVREALAAGRTYVWCAVRASTHDARDKMRAAAAEIARELHFAPGLIQFLWIDHLVAQLNRHPGIIGTHFPHIATQSGPLTTLRGWQREPDSRPEWVDFGNRKALVDRIGKHLLGTEEPNVLHIAGLSGIGKTRSVLQACESERALHGVFYIDRFANATRQVYRPMQDNDWQIQLVIDEVSFEESRVVSGWFSDAVSRVRVVTIGPARRQSYSRPDVLIVPEPNDAEDIFRVIRSGGKSLSERVLRSIASRSAHDLRLAFLLLRATLSDPHASPGDIEGLWDVWVRLTKLFPAVIGDPGRFLTLYSILTVSVDIGVAGGLEAEIDWLSTHFGEKPSDLLWIVNRTEKIGLGIRTARFYEPTPRGLAVWAFSENVWPRIRDGLPGFFGGMPERLRRRFLERCQECAGPLREEVEARLGETFLTLLPRGRFDSLGAGEAMRVFCAWAEFDPKRGLKWLRDEVESASDEQVGRLDGSRDGTGWGGRRHLVGLAQNLASFAEHFRDCEAVLFRLALHETEVSIGNNSTAIWQSLFLPVLSNTELPFGDRLPILLERLRNATPEQLALSISGAFAAASSPFAGAILPPQVVGGRVVPEPSNPKTRGELSRNRRAAGRESLRILTAMPPEHKTRVARATIGQMGLFLRLSLAAEFRSFVESIASTDDLRRHLLSELDRQITSLAEDSPGDPKAKALEQEMQSWRSSLTSTSLTGRIKDLTARDPNSVWSRSDGEESYRTLADEALRSPNEVAALGDWFDSPIARSSGHLGYFLGKSDADGALRDAVADWLDRSRCRSIVQTYLNGTRSRMGNISDFWAEKLDLVAVRNPDLVLSLTASADLSQRGLRRILKIVDSLPGPVSHPLRALGIGDWPELLSGGDLHGVLTRLRQSHAGGNDPEAPSVGIDLISIWCDRNSSPPADVSVPVALGLLKESRAATSTRTDSYNWMKVANALAPLHPDDIVGLSVDAVTSTSDSTGRFDPGYRQLVADLAALYPKLVMDAIGNVVLDEGRNYVFEIDSFPGLFEAIGLEVVSLWAGGHDRRYLPKIARHLSSPYPDDGGLPEIPPLTEWLFTVGEADDEAFRAFLAGRHLEVRTWERDRISDPEGRWAPFLDHPLRRVREWAEYEIDSERQWAAWNRTEDDEWERI